MSYDNPITRDDRQQIITVASGQTSFGPFDFKIWDTDDVRLETRATSGDDWTEVGSFTVTLAATAPAFFTLTKTGLATGSQIRVSGARVPERQTNVFRGGIIAADRMEAELDKFVTVGQELRRDIDEALPLAMSAQADATLALEQIEDIQEGVVPTGSITADKIAAGAIEVKLGYTPEDAAEKNTANGYAGLDSAGLVPAARLRGLRGAARKTLVIFAAGQSNMVGVYGGGPNPASASVKTWDGVTGAWGGSSISGLPWTRSAPDGNGGVNNIALALAHRWVDETGGEAFIIYDALSGQPISEWTPTTGARWVALTGKITAALASTELTGVDYESVFLWAQGEENYTSDYATHLAALTTLIKTQIRGASWGSATMPVLICGMSDLHDRYQATRALRYYTNFVDAASIYINPNGLETTFSTTGTGDNTHWLGPSLWNLGYYRCGDTLFQGFQPAESSVPVILARTTGEADGDDTLLIMAAGNALYSAAFQTFATGSQVLSPNYTHTLGFGEGCTISASHTAVIAGKDSVVSANYSVVAGQENTVSGSRAFGCGYQNTVSGNYSFAANRGNTASGQYASAFGIGNISGEDAGFCVGKYGLSTGGSGNPVIFQIGNGSSTASRAAIVQARANGIFEIMAPDAAIGTSVNPVLPKGFAYQWVSDTSIRLALRNAAGNSVKYCNLTFA